jgi:putative transposase
MSGFRFQVNMVFELHGAPFRIHALPANGEVLLEAQATGAMSVSNRAKLLRHYLDGELTDGGAQAIDAHKPHVPTFSRPLDELPVHVRDELTRRCRYLEAIYEDGTPVFTRRYLLPILERAAKDIGDPNCPGLTTVYRWHLRLQSTGGDARALIPRVDRRGSKSPQQSQSLLDMFQEAVTEAYRASPLAQAPDIHARLDAMVKHHNSRAAPHQHLTMPCLRTVYRLIAKISVYDKAVLTRGKSIADKRFRAVKLGVTTTRILERVEMDHTPLDLFLIDERTWLPLGRPTLTVVLEHYSRMLLGYHLSFGNPSAAAVMAALRHAILPKVPAAITIPELKPENTWPCYGLFKEVYLDNGLEFLGKDLESVALDLGFSLIYCPKRTPHFKGVVERYLKTVNYHFAHQVPGASFARFHKREDYDPLKHALLTLGEFQQLFEKWVVDVYAQTVHRGIGTTPMHRWQEGAKVWEPKLPPDLRALQRRIGQTTECKLRKDGITVHSIRYNSEELNRIMRRYGEGVTVRVVYDPEDLAEVMVWGPDDVEPEVVQALDLSYARGLTVRQNAWIRQQAREQAYSVSDKDGVLRARADITAAIGELMTSRKLKDRRRSAAMRGISSTKPEESAPRPVTGGSSTDAKAVGKRKSAANPKKAGTHKVVAGQVEVDSLPPLLTPFSLPTRKVGGEA